MPRTKRLLIPILLALIVAFVPTFFSPHPAAAKVDLYAGKGEAVWFYRSCTTLKPGIVATWSVEPAYSLLTPTSLKYQVRNAYPGYQLQCELYFANTGKLPIRVKTINLGNPNPGTLILSATVAPGEQNKTLVPCVSKLSWGKSPASLPSNCWSKIKVVMTIAPHVKENIRMEFSIQVRLEEKTNHY